MHRKKSTRAAITDSLTAEYMCVMHAIQRSFRSQKVKRQDQKITTDERNFEIAEDRISRPSPRQAKNSCRCSRTLSYGELSGGDVRHGMV